MKAGRELDCAIAEKVMGWQWVEFQARKIFVHPEHVPAMLDAPVPDLCSLLPHYSTDIAAAWEVVERTRKNHWSRVLNLVTPTDDCSEYRAIFSKKWAEEMTDWPDGVSKGESAPHAICLAALAAVANPSTQS